MDYETEQNIKESFKPEIEGIEYYRQLLCLEDNLNTRILRKKTEIKETVFSLMKLNRKLRIYLSNTFDKKTESWMFFIEGRIIDLDNKQPFTSFLRSIVFEITTEEGKEYVEWNGSISKTHSNIIGIKRKGKKETKIKIFLQKETGKYVLSEEMADVLQMKEGTRPQVIYAMWKYVKVNRLQESNEKKMITLNNPLRNIFGVSTLPFSEIPEAILQHIFPQAPLVIEYKVVVSKEKNIEPFFYDIDVEVEDSSKEKLFGDTLSMSKECFDLEEKNRNILNQLKELEIKRKKLKDFVMNPIKEINRWLYLQKDSDEAIQQEYREELQSVTDLKVLLREYTESIKSTFK